MERQTVWFDVAAKRWTLEQAQGGLDNWAYEHAAKVEDLNVCSNQPVHVVPSGLSRAEWTRRKGM